MNVVCYLLRSHDSVFELTYLSEGHVHWLDTHTAALYKHSLSALHVPLVVSGKLKTLKQNHLHSNSTTNDSWQCQLLKVAIKTMLSYYTEMFCGRSCEIMRQWMRSLDWIKVQYQKAKRWKLFCILLWQKAISWKYTQFSQSFRAKSYNVCLINERCSVLTWCTGSICHKLV